MARSQRYESSITVFYNAQVSDGFGGVTDDTPLAIVTGYACSIWKPNLRATALLRTEYGMSTDTRVIVVSGAHNDSLREGYKFIYDSDTFVVRNVSHIRGSVDGYSATQMVAEKAA